MITRTAFCQKCFDKARPKTQDVFGVKGSKGWHVKEIDYAHPHDNPPGYTPHVFELDKTEGKYAIGWKACCMQDCGLDIRHNPKHETDLRQPAYLIFYNHQEGFKMKITDWNALVLNHDLGYKIDPP